MVRGTFEPEGETLRRMAARAHQTPAKTLGRFRGRQAHVRKFPRRRRREPAYAHNVVDRGGDI